MDLIAPVRVVVIDDKPTHLFSIANGLTLAGIPCAWHWYDAKENKLTPPPPEGGYKYLRLLFTDLNLQSGSGATPDAATLAGMLINDVLKPIIAPDAGPYSIVLWTNVGGKAEAVGPIIQERINNSGMDIADRRPQPLAISTLSKTGFLPLTDPGIDVEGALTKLLENMAKSAVALKAHIAEATSKDPQLRLACAWESRASMAAAATISSVYNAAVVESTLGGTTLSESFQKVLCKIAAEASGEKNANEDPSRALDDGMIDIFVDDMRSTQNATAYLDTVKKALATVLKKGTFSLSSGARSILNKFLQIEHPSKSSSRIPRGAVLTIPDDDIEKWSGGFTKKDLLWQEFLFSPDDLVNDLKRRIKAGYPEKSLDDLNKHLVALKESIATVEKEARIVVLEIGTDCDHAQRKKRTVRLLWALEVPSALPNIDALIHPWEDSKRFKHDALFQFGPWSINDSEMKLIVSVKRFGIQQHWEREEHMTIQYRLRKPMVDYILHKYSSHSTRPGIMEITA